MQIKKLNKTHNVCKAGNAKWEAVFETGEGYTKAIIAMANMFGLGAPYTNRKVTDSNKSWLFRNMDIVKSDFKNKNHRIYLTVHEQITLLRLKFDPAD